MARAFTIAGDTSIQSTSNLGSPAATTLVALARLTTMDTNGGRIVCMRDSNVLTIEPVSGNAELRGVYYDGTTWRNITTTGNDLDDGVWFHAAYVCDPGNNRQELYLNGASVLTGALGGAIEYSQGNQTSIGEIGANWANYNFEGDEAEIGFYDRGLSSSEISFLYNGGAYRSPLFIPSGLISYLDLIDDIEDTVGGFTFVNNGTVVSPHPTVLYPFNPAFLQSDAV